MRLDQLAGYTSAPLVATSEKQLGAASMAAFLKRKQINMVGQSIRQKEGAAKITRRWPIGPIKSERKKVKR